MTLGCSMFMMVYPAHIRVVLLDADSATSRAHLGDTTGAFGLSSTPISNARKHQETWDRHILYDQKLIHYTHVHSSADCPDTPLQCRRFKKSTHDHQIRSETVKLHTKFTRISFNEQTWPTCTPLNQEFAIDRMLKSDFLFLPSLRDELHCWRVLWLVQDLMLLDSFFGKSSSQPICRLIFCKRPLFPSKVPSLTGKRLWKSEDMFKKSTKPWFVMGQAASKIPISYINPHVQIGNGTHIITFYEPKLVL